MSGPSSLFKSSRTTLMRSLEYLAGAAGLVAVICNRSFSSILFVNLSLTTRRSESFAVSATRY